MSDSSSSDGEDTWIHRFCGLEGHEMFCEIDKSYIEDSFNLFGLRHWVPNINYSLDVILDRVSENEASHELMEATGTLYGLIHARYVLTAAGLEAMYAKYTLQEFGNCPHFLCREQAVVPLGVRDEPHIETVKLFCPKCQDVYVHPSHAAQRVDGAYFGTTFPHLFFMTYKGLIPDPPEKSFVPRVFGFRLRGRESSSGGAASRGQGDNHEQRLQERRRLRRPPPPPQSPSQQTSGPSPSSRRAATASVTGSAAPSGAVGAVSGSVRSPTESERDAGAGGGGKGQARGEGKGGSVVVRIKEEKELNGTVSQEGKGTETASGAGVAATHSALNGIEASPTRVVQHLGAGTGPTGGEDSTIGESKRGGDGKHKATESGSARAAGASGAANGFIPASERRNGEEKPAVPVGDSSAGDGGERGATGAGAKVVIAAITADNGESKRSELNDDHASRTDGSRRACAEVHSAGAAEAAEGAQEGAREATEPARSGDPQERGTKRLSEMELEASAAETVGSGTGAKGVIGRARGKVPRGRHQTAPIAPA